MGGRVRTVEELSSAVSARDIAAVVVTYNPDVAVMVQLRHVATQVDRVIVVDNHSNAVARDRIRNVGTVELIENPRNLGIGVALNQGLRRAAALGYSWVLTLDQDSDVDTDLVDALGQVYARCSFSGRVGLLNANARSKYSRQVAVRCPSRAQAFIEVKTVITSGSLLSVTAYEAVGPFREDFFIEGVDLEYCLRLRSHGFRIIVSCRPLMTHAAGSMEERRLGHRVVIVPNHAPWRYYYVTRNLLRIFGAYVRRDPAWVAVAVVNLGKTLIRVMLFEDHRLAKLACVAVGAWDALVGSRRNRFLPSDS